MISSIGSLFNPNNLDLSSGANDVIVVRHRDGSLHSTPFNVRFGKVKVLRPSDKTVEVEVNGAMTAAVMKIGSDGEAYWLEPTVDAGDRPESPVEPPAGLSEVARRPDPPTDVVATLGIAEANALTSGATIPDSEIPVAVEGLFQAPAAVEQPLLTEDEHGNVTVSVSCADPTEVHLAEEAVRAANAAMAKLAQRRPHQFLIDAARRDQEDMTATVQLSPQCWASEASAVELGDSGTKGLPTGLMEELLEDTGLLRRKSTYEDFLQLIEGKQTDAHLASTADFFGKSAPQSDAAEGRGPEGEHHLRGIESSNALTVDSHTKRSISTTGSAIMLTADLKQRPREVCSCDAVGSASEKLPMAVAVNIADGPRADVVEDHTGDLDEKPSVGGGGVSLSSVSMSTSDVLSDGGSDYGYGEDDDYLFQDPIDYDDIDHHGDVARNSRHGDDDASAQQLPMGAVNESALDSRNGSFGHAPNPNVDIYFKKTIIPIQADLQKLQLREGRNIVRYITQTSLRGCVVVEASIYLWDYCDRIVVSDIDGTVTKSDLWGHLLPLFGKDWTHPGICSLYSKICANGYKFVYLTARSVSQVQMTRNFLWNIEQDGVRLPKGPVLTAPQRFFTALSQEVWKRAHLFKIACLESVIDAFPPQTKPFYAGFGNRVNDVIAYTATNIPKHKIFIIDTSSVLHVSYVKQTYKNLAHLVDVTFPPLAHNSARLLAHSGQPYPPVQRGRLVGRLLSTDMICISDPGQDGAGATVVQNTLTKGGVSPTAATAVDVKVGGGGEGSTGERSAGSLLPAADAASSPTPWASGSSPFEQERGERDGVGRGGTGAAEGEAPSEGGSGYLHVDGRPSATGNVYSFATTAYHTCTAHDNDVHVDQEFNWFNYWRVAPEDQISKAHRKTEGVRSGQPHSTTQSAKSVAEAVSRPSVVGSAHKAALSANAGSFRSEGLLQAGGSASTPSLAASTASGNDTVQLEKSAIEAGGNTGKPAVADAHDSSGRPETTSSAAPAKKFLFPFSRGWKDDKGAPAPPTAQQQLRTYNHPSYVDLRPYAPGTTCARPSEAVASTASNSVSFPTSGGNASGSRWRFWRGKESLSTSALNGRESNPIDEVCPIMPVVPALGAEAAPAKGPQPITSASHEENVAAKSSEALPSGPVAS